MALHELKTDPEPFDAVADGRKTHEVRRNDRNYEVGDELILRRTEYTGVQMRLLGKPLVYSDVPSIRRRVTHIQSGYGLNDHWVILSLATPYEPAA